MDKADDLTKVEDTLQALTASKKTELELANKKSNAQGQAKAPIKVKRGQPDKRWDKVPSSWVRGTSCTRYEKLVAVTDLATVFAPTT